MPKSDVTTRALQKAAATILNVVDRVDKEIPWGPGIEKLSVPEQRKRLESMTPDERNMIVETMGVDPFMEMLQKIYTGREGRRRVESGESGKAALGLNAPDEDANARD